MGLAQNPSISQDITKWNNEEITIMEKTLCRFIPLVRFCYISPEDFVDKIYPLKELLPKDLVGNLLIFHTVPDGKPGINTYPPRQFQYSKLFSVIASWIDKKENLHYNRDNNPYSFKLLYSSSGDGNTVAAFYAECDNKRATIVMVKIKNSEQIVGGYNPLFWDSSNSWKKLNDSFLFSFTDRNIITAKVSYCNINNSRVYCHQDYGPVFGFSDLYIDMIYNSSDTWCSTYPKIDDMPTGYFKVDYYEVFQGTRK